MILNFCALSSFFYLSLKIVAAHLDQQCNFGMCLNAFMVPIKNAYCDNNNKCKCIENYVAVSLHRCAEIQSPGKPCEHDNVCKSRDENSFCDQNRMHPVCECKKSHIFDSEHQRCIPYVKKSRKSTPLFPMTAIILIACIGIFCGCAIICHNFRRQPELSASNEHLGRVSRSPNHATNSSTSNGNFSNNDVSETEPVNPRLLRSDSYSSSSKYDSSLYDEPPPKYEDAIRDCPEVVSVELPMMRNLTTVLS